MSRNKIQATCRLVDAVVVADILGAPDSSTDVWCDFRRNGEIIRVRKWTDAVFAYVKNYPANGDNAEGGQSCQLERDAVFCYSDFDVVRYTLKQGGNHLIDPHGVPIRVLEISGLLNGDDDAGWNAANDNAEEFARIIEAAPGSVYALEEAAPTPQSLSPLPSEEPPPLTIARGYLKRGWNPIPVSRRTKTPIGNSWRHRRLDSKTVAGAFNRADMNVGVQLGPLSDGLSDVDLDCREAVMVGPMLLPSSNNIFGRASKPRSHWLYSTRLADRIDRACLQFRDVDGAMMLELKIGGGGKGSQSVFPGSTHTSGEAIEWDRDGAPVIVDDDKLLRQVQRLAVAVMLARHWPEEGARHDAALTVGGFLARAGFDADEAALTLEAIARAAGDDQGADRAQAARDAVRQYGNGGETRGFPALAEAFGEKAANKAAQWLGYQGGYEPDNGLPDLVIGHEPTAVAKELARLIAQGDHYFFNGNAPVRIAIEVNDMPRAIEVTAENVRVLAHEISNPVRRTKEGMLPAEIRTDVANIYLKGLEGRWGLKRFAGIATTPILSGDGTIHSMDGYDPVTGLWCHNIPALSIPENPSGREAAAALLRIRHTFRTFPFADAARMRDPHLGADIVDPDKPAGLDESTFLVALLTAACRPSLETAPGFLCDAPTLSGAGTGKGLLVKAICITASGARPHAFTSGHDAAEFDKRLTAALVQAHPAIFLDNFNAKEISSDILASALTENPAQVRIMGQTKMVPLHVCTFIGITGNGVEIAEDMARRLLNSRLDARMENPEERKFRPGFLDDILAQRPGLLSDLLTIWRWARQNPGILDTGRPLGSYETWAQWVRDPLLTLGLRDPVERIAEIKAKDPKRRALVELFDLWHEKHKEAPVRAAQLDPEIIQLIDLRARKKDDGSLQYSRQRVARFLTQRAGTCVGGYVLTQGKEGPDSKAVANYTLARTTPEPAHRRNTGETDTSEPVQAATPSPDAAVGKCERPNSDEPCSEAAHKGIFEIVGRALAGSRCYLCGKGREVYLIRREGDRAADQAHLACAKKAGARPE